MRKPGTLLLATVLLASAADAQTLDPRPPGATWGVSVGLNHDRALGAALTGFAAHRLHAFGIPLRGTVALDVLLTEDSRSPYYYTENLDGTDQRACVDSRDGLRAEGARCLPDLGLAGRAELMGVLSPHWGVGAGARLGASWDAGPYGLVRYEHPLRAGRSAWFGQLSGGEGFSQLDAGVAIRF